MAKSQPGPAGGDEARGHTHCQGGGPWQPVALKICLCPNPTACPASVLEFRCLGHVFA